MMLKFLLVRTIEIAIVSFVILIIWSAMAQPTLFYFLPIPYDVTGQPSFKLPNTSLPIHSNGLPAVLQCSEGFYYSVNGSCTPECGLWTSLSQSSALTFGILGTILTIVGLLSALVTFMFAYIRHKKLTKFPLIIIVYQSISSVPLHVLLLSAYGGGDKLVCSSRSIIEVRSNPTWFCIFTGVVSHYIIMQMAVWWLFHVAVIFWRLLFPFHAKYWERRGAFKYIHATMLIVGLVFPCIVPIATLATDSFITVDYLPQLCALGKTTVVYYAFVLPISIILASGVTLAWILAWIVIKERAKKRKSTEQPRVVDFKLSISVLFYILVSVASFTTFSVLFAKVDHYTDELTAYFTCEASGIIPGKPTQCDRSTFEGIAFPALFNVSHHLFVLIPTGNLIYLIRWIDLKSFCTKLHCIMDNSERRAKAPSSSNTNLSPGSQVEPLPADLDSLATTPTADSSVV